MGRSHELPDDGLRWFPHLLRDDRPVHAVSLDAFEIDVHEVTNEQYLAFVVDSAGRQAAPHHWPDGRPREDRLREPVANVTWQEARSYCKWRGMRLPTEAEWERTCRGNLIQQKHPWGDDAADADKAHFDSVRGPVAVCGFERNGYGLCDMAGNVWEWTADRYGREYYAESPSHNPLGPSEGRYRVIRGGSWADVPKFLTCAHRSFARPAERSPNLGFRCARTAR